MQSAIFIVSQEKGPFRYNGPRLIKLYLILNLSFSLPRVGDFQFFLRRRGTVFLGLELVFVKEYFNEHSLHFSCNRKIMRFRSFEIKKF